jgi:hypothetical protein
MYDLGIEGEVWKSMARRLSMNRCARGMASVFIGLAVFSNVVMAERLENQVAIFSALDKVTARTSKFEVELGKTATFGSLKVTPRACYSRPETELPKTTTFVEVDEVQLDGQQKRIFTGWMFAESPGLFGVEHPTIDVWLTECQKPTNAVAQKAPEPKAKPADGNEPAAAAPEPADVPAEPPRRRPVRR